jgi:hypothetical protein
MPSTEVLKLKELFTLSMRFMRPHSQLDPFPIVILKTTEPEFLGYPHSNTVFLNHSELTTQ